MTQKTKNDLLLATIPYRLGPGHLLHTQNGWRATVELQLHVCYVCWLVPMRPVTPFMMMPTLCVCIVLVWINRSCEGA